MNEWIDELSDMMAAGDRVVVVTVAGVRGSAPREVGAKMIVTETETVGTIGGGQLEYQCTHIASGMLGDDEFPAIRTFPLGAGMGQCCGGVVDVLFEPMASGLPSWLQHLAALHGQREAAVICTNLATARHKFVVSAESVYGQPGNGCPNGIVSHARDELREGAGAHRDTDWFFEPVVSTDFNIAIFGAGHVGSAVVRSLAALDCNIRWIDNRRNVFRDTPANVRAIETAEPAMEVAAMPAHSCYLIMTHSHGLDFDICDRVLRRRDVAYCGLIGSRSKRRRFEKRFREQGLSREQLERLVCPIGVEGISGKKPAEIAVAAAAEVLQAYENQSRGDVTVYPDNVHPLQG